MKVRKNLVRNKRIMESLLELRRPHQRMQYCQKPTPKMAKWWARRLRKREEKRKERQLAMMKGFVRAKKMTQRELKQQRRKDILSELSKGIKGRLPHFRMLYKAVNIGGPLPLELQQRKHIKKRKVLAVFKKEHNLLLGEISYLLSPSAEAETNSMAARISKLTQEKMFWDHIFNEVSGLIKLLSTKIAENGTTLEKMNVKMNKIYFDRKNKEKFMITQPVYFGEIEYHMYPEKRIHTRKSIKERYLEDLAEIENLFMALEKKGEEVNHYLRTRELFVSVLDKILNRLNRGKRIVLDFLQDGHNIMNDLTTRFLDLMSMKKMTGTIGNDLEMRKRQAQNERAMMILETKDLMARHRPTQMSNTYRETRSAVSDPARSLEEVKARLTSDYEVFQKSLLVMGGITDKDSARIKDYTSLSKHYWIPQMQQLIKANAFLMQKITFPLIETNFFKKRVEEARKSILLKKQARRGLRNKVKEHKNRMVPILESARTARLAVRNEYIKLYQTWRRFRKPLRDLYGLLCKRSSFNADKLGIHNRMTEFNKIECLNYLVDSVPNYVSKLVHREREGETRLFPFTTIVRKLDRDRIRHKRYQLIRQLRRPQTEHLRKKKDFQIAEHPPLHKSPCPLCCVEERLSKMALVEQFEDHIRSVYEIQCELRDTQETKDLQELNHPIWECNQPAARSLIQLLILEDRTPEKIMDFTKMAQ